MSGVDDDKQKALDLYDRYRGNPWFDFGLRAYERFTRVKGFWIRFCRGWRCRLRHFLRITSVVALASLLIVATSFAPIDTRGWYSTRKAYAVVGVDDVVIGAGVAALLLLTGGYVANQAGVDYAGIAKDFGSWASDSLKNTVWENGSEWVNPTASGSGYTVDVSKVPDDVLKGVMDYGAHLSSADSATAYNMPSSVSLPLYCTTGRAMSDTVNIGSNMRARMQQLAETYPYVYIVSSMNPNKRRVLQVWQSNLPISFTWDYTNSNKQYIELVWHLPAGCSAFSNSTIVDYQSGESYTYSIDYAFSSANQNYSSAYNLYSGATYAISLWQSSPYDISAVDDVPTDISSPIQAYQADPTDENAQAAIDAIHAANPSVAMPETAPQTINNYNEYVTVNNGSGEVVNPDTPVQPDLTGLADAIAQALGGGATIAAVLAALRSVLDGMVTSDALAGEFAGIDALLRQLVNLEQRAEQWRQQQELNADLDEIKRLLTSIDENVSGILQDMVNLDRSTGDLVNLQPVIDAINGLQMPGDPVATDLSKLEHQLLDMTDTDGVTLTVHGLLHWINYYLQDIDRFLHDWNPYDPIDYSTVLNNIYDEIADFTSSFSQFWTDLNGKLNTIINDLENLKFAPRYPTNPYPRPPSNPETGIVPWEDMLNVNALRDAITRMMQKFPFATINNFVLILTMLVRPAQAPQFDLPLPNPSDWSDPYMVHVDLSIWDVPAAVLRTGTMLWAIARVSRRTVALWTSEEGGGEGA